VKGGAVSYFLMHETPDWKLWHDGEGSVWLTRDGEDTKVMSEARSKKTCAICGWCRVFIDEAYLDGRYYECHRNAATPNQNNAYGFPYVRADDFCDEWAARDEATLTELLGGLIKKATLSDGQIWISTDGGYTWKEEWRQTIEERIAALEVAREEEPESCELQFGGIIPSLTIECPGCNGLWTLAWRNPGATLPYTKAKLEADADSTESEDDA